MKGRKGIHTAWAIGIENTGNTNFDIVLPHVSVREGLGNTLTLVIASTRTNRVDMSPAGKRSDREWQKIGWSAH
jgi:hypothetical protein